MHGRIRIRHFLLFGGALLRKATCRGLSVALKPRTLPPSIERTDSAFPGALIVGVDEAGRGAWAGPVVAAAVAVRPGAVGLEKGIQDSKQLNERQREWVFEQLMHHPDVYWGISQTDERRIEEVNILQATFEAMSTATHEAMASAGRNLLATKKRILVDGNQVPPQLLDDYPCKSASY